jgi:hypothetical protein
MCRALVPAHGTHSQVRALKVLAALGDLGVEFVGTDGQYVVRVISRGEHDHGDVCVNFSPLVVPTQPPLHEALDLVLIPRSSRARKGPQPIPVAGRTRRACGSAIGPDTQSATLVRPDRRMVGAPRRTTSGITVGSSPRRSKG